MAWTGGPRGRSLANTSPEGSTMNRETTIVAGVVAAIATAGAAAPDASGGTLYTRSDLDGVAENTQFLTLVHQELHRPPRALAAWGSNPTLPSGPYTYDVQIDSPPDFDSYALIGVDENGGVMVSFADPSKAIGQEFDALFPGFSESALDLSP